MNRDFAEMLSALSAAGVEFLIVGVHAVAVHGRPRATGDLDIWVRPTPENAERIWSALERFGAPLFDLKREDLASPGVVFQIGVLPCRIDILTDITGVTFDEAWPGRLTAAVGGQTLPFIGRDQLLANKRAVGRPKGLGDVAFLEGRDDGGR
jgi:hypothetical protein